MDRGDAGWKGTLATLVRLQTFLAVSAALAALMLAPQIASAAGSGSFSPTASLSTPRAGPVEAPLPDGRVLVAGGNDANGHYLKSVEAYNSQTNSWSPLASMLHARQAASAAPLADGRVLVAGGYDGSWLQSAEVYDPQADSWSPVADMSRVREEAVAAPLPDGRVLVAGGDYDNSSGQHFRQAAEVFDPGTNSWSPVGNMGIARGGAMAATLPDGRVLVAGGTNNSTVGSLQSAEVFSPQTNSFSSAGIGPMVTPRWSAAAARLPDGRVLVAGGYQPSSYLTSAEVFSPGTNSFGSAGIGSMATPRVAAVAAPLSDGRVLVAGGYDGVNVLQSAEIFSATNTFQVAMQERNLLVSVQASGGISVRDARSPLSASASKKKKKKKPRLLLNPSSASGNPPTITVPLSLTKAAKNRLKKKGKVTVNARITFTPQGGLANTQSATLKIKGKKKKKN